MRALATVLVLAACVSDRPPETVVDVSGESVQVEILGDGFVRTGERRIPLDAFVLELRQSTRRMTPEALAGFVVQVRVSPALPDEVAGRIAAEDLNRLLEQLDIMDVPLVKYF